MAGTPRKGKHEGTAASAEKQHSPETGNTTADGGYPEQHGPRHDADGWGEANTTQGKGEPESQGHKAGERSFDHGPADPAAEQAASEAALREPGERGAADALPPTDGQGDEASPEDAGQPPDFDGRQRDYGQGGGLGYVHTGKPGAPGPDSK